MSMAPGTDRISGDPLALVPPPPRGDDFSYVREAVACSRSKIVVLDDDPTGTQTVQGISVLTEWSVDLLITALREPSPAFYVLTNSRALERQFAIELNRQIAINLAAAARATGINFSLISRSDSTLRGHFPSEVEALAGALAEPVDHVLVIPAFIEGGRITVDNVHYVRDGDKFVPAGNTEFARDATFGYRSSHLAAWVEEKTQGKIARADVAHINLAGLRSPEGAAGVERQLLTIPRGRVITVDAADYADLEVFVHGLLRAEQHGRRYLARSAASFVRVRAGIAPAPLLATDELSPADKNGGLIVVGSYIAKTTAQLHAAFAAPGSTPEEINVDALSEDDARKAEVARVAAVAEKTIQSGRHALLYTSRRLVSSAGRAGELGAAQRVSGALVDIVRALRERPRFFIAKGGITSSVLATQGLGVKKALVLGQAAPGIPVWRLGPESKFPGLAYLVFPGNVGGPDALRELIARLDAPR